MTATAILVITNRYPTDDKPFAGKFVERHVELHRKAGHRIEVISTGDSRTGRFRSIYKYFHLAMDAVWQALFGQFELVHAHWPFPSGLFGWLISKTRRVPFLLTSHGAFVDDFETQPDFVKRLVRLVLRKADFIICVGEKNREKIVREMNVSPEKTAVCPMGVWLETTPPPQETARRQLQLPLNEFLLIFVGNFNKAKGADLLIEALALLAQTTPFHCFFGGQGAMEELMKQRIAELNLEQRCTVLGTLLPQDVPTWLAAADVCAVPSRREAFGLVAVEAMAAKTAVVASRVGGLTQTIIHQHNGWLFEPENIAQLAAAIQTLYQNPDLRRRLGRNGQIDAQKYNMRTAAAEVSRIYQTLVEQQRA